MEKMKIGLISDTHGYMDDRILEHFKECEEVWHAGDVGDMEVITKLTAKHNFRGVFGNIDGGNIRLELTEDQIFEIFGQKIWIRHIGGYPPKYGPGIKKRLDEINPDLFICGHSHIPKAIPDKERNLLHLNPGAAGTQGFHKIRTMMRFEIGEEGVTNLQLIELGVRGKIKP
jgi:hypothetical protein